MPTSSNNENRDNEQVGGSNLDGATRQDTLETGDTGANRNSRAQNAHSHDCGHSHDHSSCSHEIVPPGDSLWKYIDHQRVRCLNESESGTARAILRPYPQKLDTLPILESDVDPELLLIIPFTGLVQLHAVHIRSTADDRAPRDLRLFKNREDLDFEVAADLQPTQTLEHPHGIGVGSTDNNGIVEYSLSRAKFSNMTSLAIHIPESWGDDTSALVYVGLTGTCKKLSKAPVVAMYEAAANPADHRVKDRLEHGATIQ